MSRPRVLTPRRFRWLLNFYPPLLLQRVRVVEVRDDFRFLRVRVARSLLTRNLHGTTFGGTIYSAADPFYALMFWQIFARRGEVIHVWMRSARTRFLRPVESALELRFSLSEADIEEAAASLAEVDRFVKAYPVDLVDRSGRICAVVESEVYLGRKRSPETGQLML